jgi:uncharacterized protein CbrC (UPF0167 family)
LAAEEIPEHLIAEEADNQGVDVKNIVNSLDQGDACFHRFECLSCQEQILIFDFFV